MKYADVRDSIESGTVVFFEAVSWKAKIISLFTGGTVSHCGLATWIYDSQGDRRLMLIESTSGGARVVNLSSYLGRDMTFVKVQGFNWINSEHYALDKTGHDPYGYKDFLMIGLKSILVRMGWADLSLKVNNYKGEVCSEMVSDVLMRDGIALPSTMLSPQDLLDWLLQNVAHDAFKAVK